MSMSRGISDMWERQRQRKFTGRELLWKSFSRQPTDLTAAPESGTSENGAQINLVQKQSDKKTKREIGTQVYSISTLAWNNKLEKGGQIWQSILTNHPEHSASIY